MYNGRPWGKRGVLEKNFEEITGSTHWKDLTVFRVYASNSRALTSRARTTRKTRQTHSYIQIHRTDTDKDIKYLNNIINLLDLIDIYIM